MLFKTGVERGRKEGMERGRKEGIEQGRKDIIFSMFKSGMSIEQIAKITKEPAEDIKKLTKTKRSSKNV